METYEQNRHDNMLTFMSLGGTLINMSEITAPVFDALYDSLQQRMGTEPWHRKTAVRRDLEQLDGYIRGFGHE